MARFTHVDIKPMTRLCFGIGICLILGSQPLLLVGAKAAEPDAHVEGDAAIRAQAGKSEIVISTSSRFAGAIHSLKWNGKEFIDSADHGRLLQSASSFDIPGKSAKFFAEQYNPTEAGSRLDGDGMKSSSKLLNFSADGPELSSTTQMAFWLASGEKTHDLPALNEQVLSDHLLAKRVRLGHKEFAQVIEYDVTFTVPPGEKHSFAQFEALTGYMPAEFEQFWKFVPDSQEFEKLDDGPGEQKYPVVFSTADGAHALGVFSPDQPARGFETAGYGRFRFPAEKVVKWNCVFRERNENGIAPGERRFRLFLAIGSLSEVKQLLATLAKTEIQERK